MHTSTCASERLSTHTTFLPNHTRARHAVHHGQCDLDRGAVTGGDGLPFVAPQLPHTARLLAAVKRAVHPDLDAVDAVIRTLRQQGKRVGMECVCV